MSYNGVMLISQMMGKEKEISTLQDKLKRRATQIADLKHRIKELQTEIDRLKQRMSVY